MIAKINEPKVLAKRKDRPAQKDEPKAEVSASGKITIQLQPVERKRDIKAEEKGKEIEVEVKINVEVPPP